MQFKRDETKEYVKFQRELKQLREAVTNLRVQVALLEERMTKFIAATNTLKGDLASWGIN